MTAVFDRKATILPAMDAHEARVVTETIKEHTTTVWNMLIEAHERKAAQALGYATWSDYVRSEFNMSRSRSYQIIDQARTIHAIESVVSTTVDISEAAARDIKPRIAELLSDIEDQLASTSVDTDEERREIVAEVIAEHRAQTIQVDDLTVDERTGEVIDGPTITAEPVVEERTFTEKVKISTPSEPKPIPRGDDANRLNAIQASKSIGRSLEALQYLNYENARNGIVTDWWPIGKNDVPPEQASYFTPAELRKLAQGLNKTADLLEAHHVH